MGSWRAEDTVVDHIPLVAVVNGMHHGTNEHGFDVDAWEVCLVS